MAILQAYHRPATLDQAVALLANDKARLAPLAGGTRLIGQLETRQIRDLDGVVDLGRLGLDAITVADDTITLGAMVSLSDVIEHDVAGVLAGGLLRRAAKGEGPLNLRNMATIGGLVATAEYDSEFYAALLALNASVTIRDETGDSLTPLTEFTDVRGLVTAVTLPMVEARCGLARIARTPSDRPIVAAVAVISEHDERVTLCGVAERPVLQGSPLLPASNFKGSAEYRRSMMPIVIERALEEARG